MSISIFSKASSSWQILKHIHIVGFNWKWYHLRTNLFCLSLMQTSGREGGYMYLTLLCITHGYNAFVCSFYKSREMYTLRIFCAREFLCLFLICINVSSIISFQMRCNVWKVSVKRWYDTSGFLKTNCNIVKSSWKCWHYRACPDYELYFFCYCFYHT